LENQTPKKILIVDDDQAFVRALTTFLTGHGYSVVVALDAVYAIQYVHKEDIALVILDLGLPCGGGFSVLENIRKVRRDVQLRIIVSTANVAPGIEEESREKGADDFILKPYDLEKLLELIKVQLA
jgi:DNA-binding response OmpR family regulator